MVSFADRLRDAIDRKRSVVCVGLDPMPELFPPQLLPSPADRGDLRDRLDAVYRFCQHVLEAVEPYAVAVKLQSACFEVFHGDGVDAYFSLVQEAAERGLLTIGDVKRGDIGTTSAAYAKAHLAPIDPELEGDGELATPDAITVSPFLGLDTLEPFLAEAAAHGKGVFVLVRTSNPGSSLLQDAVLRDGRTLSESLADALAPIAEHYPAACGWSQVGAVVGATQPHTMASLRRRLPRSVFLLPGYGAQGATADMTREAFRGGPALVSASRSVLYAFRDARYAGLADYRQAIAHAARDMRDDLNRVVTLGGPAAV
ncbi:MAG: orotidine-5'-phosphate decarboxylase [Tepidisphaerales bacterium]